MANKIQIRRDTAANWTSSNPILAQAEIGIETDTRKAKFGDGTTAWNSIAAYFIVPSDSFELTSSKDATGGYAGLTLFKINFKNVLNTFTSFFTNSNTAARTYTFQDRNGTIADDTDLGLKLNKLVTTNRQTSSYTLVIGDADKLVEMNSASANNLTVPLNSSVAFSIGTSILISQYGAGQTTVVATGGVTIRAAVGLKISAQYAGAALVKIAADEWYLQGSLSA